MTSTRSATTAAKPAYGRCCDKFTALQTFTLKDLLELMRQGGSDYLLIEKEAGSVSVMVKRTDWPGRRDRHSIMLVDEANVTLKDLTNLDKVRCLDGDK
jgi:hypothetical protein